MCANMLLQNFNIISSAQEEFDYFSVTHVSYSSSCKVDNCTFFLAEKMSVLC